MNKCSRKGSILQTLVMCILMATISVMVMKWVMMRYSMAVRLERSVQSRARAEGTFYNRMATWNYTIAPANFAVVVNGKSINGTVSNAVVYGQNVSRVNVTTDQDQ